MNTKRENIRHGRGKSFEIEAPRGFSGIEAIVSWCDDGGGWHREAFESFLDAEAPDRKEGFWRLAKWAVAWLMENLLYCEDECGECRDYEEFGL